MAPSRAGKWELQVRCGGGDAGRAGEWHRAASRPPPRYKGLGRAASLPAQAAVPSRATERDAPPAAASRVPRDTAAAGRPGPGRRPARAPCTHRRTFAGGSPRSTWGGRGHGVVPWEKLRTPAPASGSKQHGDKLGRRTNRESLEPPPASAELTPRPQPPGRLAGAPVYFRGYTAPPRRSSEADRPREGVPATPAAPAPASPRGAPGAARTPPLDPAPSRRRAGLGTGSQAAGEAGERRAPLG